MTTPTDPATPPDPAQPPATPPDGGQGAPSPTDPPDGAQGGDQSGQDGTGEAARYRRRLRDTETERDGLRGHVERLQRAEVERLAGEVLAQPGDLFTLGTTLADVLDDQGEVDPERVRAAAGNLATQRPGLRVATPSGGASMGQGRRSTEPTGGVDSWGKALHKRASGSSRGGKR